MGCGAAGGTRSRHCDHRPNTKTVVGFVISRLMVGRARAFGAKRKRSSVCVWGGNGRVARPGQTLLTHRRRLCSRNYRYGRLLSGYAITSRVTFSGAREPTRGSIKFRIIDHHGRECSSRTGTGWRGGHTRRRSPVKRREIRFTNYKTRIHIYTNLLAQTQIYIQILTAPNLRIIIVTHVKSKQSYTHLKALLRTYEHFLTQSYI